MIAIHALDPYHQYTIIDLYHQYIAIDRYIAIDVLHRPMILINQCSRYAAIDLIQ